MTHGLMLTAYALSGLAGLVYEVSWTRWLTLVLGHGLAATSTVLATFMGGLAMGAAAAGRWAPRLTSHRSLQLYAAIELTLAALALAVPMGLAAATPLLGVAYRESEGGTLFGLARLVVCAALLVPPAGLLGATFPLAIRGLADDTRDVPPTAGRLYAVNTTGAAAGALLSGFVWLPAWGLTGTLALGMTSSLAAAGLALLAGRGQTRPTQAAAAQTVEGLSPDPRQGGRRSASRRTRQPAATSVSTVPKASTFPLAAIIVSLTGFVTFSAEIAWTRFFALIIGPSTYAFAATVSAFIGGLAIGALAAKAIARRAREQVLALGVVLGIAAVAAAAASCAAGTWLPRRMVVDFIDAPTGPLLPRHALMVALLIVPTAAALGIAFPFTLAWVRRDLAQVQRIGWLYVLNTLASVAGSLVTGFLAIPFIGLEWTLRAGSVLIAGAAALLATRTALPWAARSTMALPAFAAVVIGLAGARWDRELLASGSYKYAAGISSQLDVETALRAGTLVYFKDGPTGTVSVKQLTGHLSLAIDGKVDASTAGDMLTQKLLAHVPLLLHERPRQVAVIGLGSGVTVASALTHPIDAVDVLEISAEVAEASRLFASRTASSPFSPLDDPRTRLLVADGRTHFLLTDQRYDVVVSEPSNPWMAGVAALFTREFFGAARERLAPRGVLCQWINTYDISTEDLRSVVGTFASVFPHVTLWLVGEGDLLMVGAREPFDDRLEALPTAWRRPHIADDLRSVGVMEPFGVLSTFLGGTAAAARFGGGAPSQTDDRLALEFSTPRALRTASRVNVQQLRASVSPTEQPPAIASAWAEADGDALVQRAAMLREAGAYEAAYQAALDAIAAEPLQAGAFATLVDAAVASGRQPEALVALKALANRYPARPEAHLALSRLHAAQGVWDDAAQAATDGIQRAPGNAASLEQLASVFADASDARRLEGVVAALLTQHPSRPSAHYYRAALGFMKGDLSAAEVAARETLTIDPRHARAQNLLGAIRAMRGETDAARQAFTDAMRLDPKDPTAYQNLALLELNAGNHAAAKRSFAEALSLDPTSRAARDGLSRAKAVPNR